MRTPVAESPEASSAPATPKAEPTPTQPADSAPASPPTTSGPEGPPPAPATSHEPVSYADLEEEAKRVDPESSRDPRVKNGATLPLGQTPDRYLKRLMEHFVTHEPGFVAADQGCTHKISVELFPLQVGWTAFARYSGTGREERVDQLLPTELSPFAERSVLALLHDRPISLTMDRDNVLWADSLKSTQRVRGRSSVMFGVGTRLRVAMLPTVDDQVVENDLRLCTPMALQLGYRGQFDAWGVEAAGELDLGTEAKSVAQNSTGGHIDYGGSTGLALHVLRYQAPRALASFYYGAGANFNLHWFRAIRAEGASGLRSTLFGGGLDVDLVGGYEFMRASAVTFYLQGEATLPAYLVKNANYDATVNTWFPGLALRLGASF